MIHSLKELFNAANMLFSQLFARLQNRTSRQDARKSSFTKPSSLIKGELPKYSLLEINDNLDSTTKLNKALDDIEKALQSEAASDQLLLQKADILLRKQKFHQARQLLSQLSEKKGNTKTTTKAKQLLILSNQIQQESRIQKLIPELHETAQIYGYKIINLPKPKGSGYNLDIPLLVRKEARRARTNELPKLAIELIEQTIQAGYDSPWLLHEKALSLSMMGQQKKALSLLNNLKETAKGTKLKTSIKESLDEIQQNPKPEQVQTNNYFFKQSKAICKSNSIKPKFIPGINNISDKTSLKPLVFREARALLELKPKASLGLANTILDYFQNDLAALQLKGEALSELGRDDEAIQTFEGLTRSQNEKIALKSTELISECIAKKAKKVSRNKSPKMAISFFIDQHLDRNLSPVLTEDAREILERIEPTNTDVMDADLRNHQVQLEFNTLLIECFERQRSEQDGLNTDAPAQKPGVIRKTAPKAG